jgi:hypothetical protein
MLMMSIIEALATKQPLFHVGAGWIVADEEDVIVCAGTESLEFG